MIDKVSVRFEAETYHTHLTPTYTFGQLRRDAARFFGPAIQNQTTFLTDVSGCVWPEEAMIIDVLDKTRRESENDPLELVLRLRDGYFLSSFCISAFLLFFWGGRGSSNITPPISF